MKQKKSHLKGFTLVELLAVIAITGVIGSLMFGILFATLQGANKSTSLDDISQNGNFVLAQIARVVRYSNSLTDPATCYSGPTPIPVTQSSITVVASDNLPTTFACDTSGGAIASNGANLLDPNQVVVTACSFTCTQNTAFDSPSITINFTLGKKGANNLVENSSTRSFQTSVTLRNIR
ncbi:MAG TPA: type II secretion system protein [Patescibacteria group bacterium]|nr:type II secretion system protein [Patescibacteria group bacterium]